MSKRLLRGPDGRFVTLATWQRLRGRKRPAPRPRKPSPRPRKVAKKRPAPRPRKVAKKRPAPRPRKPSPRPRKVAKKRPAPRPRKPSPRPKKPFRTALGRFADSPPAPLAPETRGPTGLRVIQSGAILWPVEERGYYARIDAFVTATWATPSAPVFDEIPGETWYRCIWCTKVKRTIKEVVAALTELIGDRMDYSDITDNPFQIETITLCCLLGRNWQSVEMGTWEPDPRKLLSFPKWLIEA